MASSRMTLNFFRWRSLKTRVTLFTLGIFLISIWSLALYASRMLREDMQRVLGEQQFSTVSYIAAQVNQELASRMSALEKTAEQITPAMLGNRVALQALLEQRPTLPILFNAGNVVFNADSTAIADFPVAPGRVGVTYKNLSIVRSALDEGRASYGKPILSKTSSTGNPIIGFGTPIRDGQGRVVGVLAGVTDLGKPNFMGQITQSRYGRTGGYLLVAPQHRLIVTATERRLVMTPVPKPGTEPLIDRFVQGYEGSGVLLNPLGVRVLASAKRVPAAGWYIVAALPTEEAFAPLEDMQRRILLAAIALTLLAGGLSWWMLRRQLAPMLDAVQTLAASSLSDQPPQPLPVTSQDEIGDLIGGFNRLLQDIAHRDEALRAREERYRKLFEGASDGIMILNTSGKLVSVNKSFARMHGYSVEGMLSMNLQDLDPPEMQQLMPERMQRILSGEVITFDVEHYHKDGHLFPLEVSASLIQADGEPLVQAFHRDLTERRRLEEVNLQAQKMAALGTLAGGVAHDFNNIIAVIMGNVELARQDAGPAHAALESLEEIRKASRRGKDLVQQILAFGRRQLLQRKVIALAPVVEEAGRLLRSTLPAGVGLKVQCDADAPAVLADPNQIEQVLLNLCNNAWQALDSDKQEAMIEVRLQAHVQAAGAPPEAGYDAAVGELQPGRYACISVRDNGCGMDKDTLARIFEPFFTTKPIGEGTGLGLAVVHSIAQDHGACIHVRSLPGEGSSFRLCFPAAQASEEAARTVAASVAPVHGQGKRILYLDDDEAVVFLMTRLLERQGYRVRGFTDARAALAAVRSDPRQFELVVTDYNMPGMSGLQVAQALKQVRGDLPVALASGYITDELRAKAPAAGISELIYKPNTVEELCAAVARLAQTVTANSKPI